jgi:exopolyphosphatase/guanosine-5'-triphosphate,3'-diphosphate pyrophosphatase
MATATVIDIGSNTIKVLVATQVSPSGDLAVLKTKTIEARISAGISHSSPVLSDEAITRGLAAIKDLLKEASIYSSDSTVLVATSAVRDALNGSFFCAQILKETGYTVRILSGEEEANGIGRGLLCDPLLKSISNFMVFDLGGGSLECLNFVDRKITQKVSLPLGCVRLTESFVSDPSSAFEASAAISEHVKEVIKKSGFIFTPAVVAVGTGGTLTSARAILALKSGLTLEASSATLSIKALKEISYTLSVMPLKERLNVPGLPKGRADVFPAALETLIALSELAHVENFHHSLYNLRWGLASEALSRA